MDFDLSDSQPIRVLPRIWSEKEDVRHNMHYGLELGILLKGRMPRYYGDFRIDVKPGEIWLCGMWEPHGYVVPHPPCEGVILVIYPPVLARMHFEEAAGINWLSSYEAAPGKRPQIPKQFRRDILDIGKSLRDKAASMGVTEKEKAWLRLKLLEILLMVHKEWQGPQNRDLNSDSSTSRLNEALKLVFDNKRFVSTQEAAGICGMHRNSFSRLFKQLMNVEFSEFSLRYRVSSAAEELLSEGTPIKALAVKWGFTDTSHIHRCFKKYFACSPAEYRNRTSGR